MRSEIYENVSSKIGKGVMIKKSLCLYNPQEVYNALNNNIDIKKWHRFITQRYAPERKEILLIYPCSTVKPYNQSRSYKQLYKHLDALNGKRKKIQVMTISEPFGLVPEEYYDKFQWYDCPGLFEWWCNKYGQDFDKDYLDKSLDILSTNIGIFLSKAVNERRYKRIIGFVRTFTSRLETKHDHTHRRMLEMASEKYNLDIEILPTKKEIKNLVARKGTFAWDMYGVAHPFMLRNLVHRLENN
jgi:archaeosine synthase